MTFLWKWRMEKTLVCMASRQRSIRKIKRSFYCTQEFTASWGTGCAFRLSHQWDVMSFVTPRAKVPFRSCLSSLGCRITKGVVLATFLSIMKNQPLVLPCDFEWIHFIRGFPSPTQTSPLSKKKKKSKAIQKFVHSLFLKHDTRRAGDTGGQTRPCGEMPRTSPQPEGIRMATLWSLRIPCFGLKGVSANLIAILWRLPLHICGLYSGQQVAK